jgi:putative membrane protein
MKARTFASYGALVFGLISLVALPAVAQPEPAAAGPTDPQIAAIVVAANQVDIDAAKLAKSRTKNKEVKSFAETMIRDHSSVNKQATALCKKLKVTPEENATSKSLTDGGKQNVDDLKKLKGAEFDKAYVDHEVAYHQQVLDAINNTLIPNAKNAELKALLEKVAPVIQAHLDHAKKMQADLGGAAAK